MAEKKRIKNKTEYILLLILVTIGMVYQWRMQERSLYLQQQIADKVLRFHVLANSDSDEDQNLKRLVRDAVGGYVQQLFEANESVLSLADCEEILQQHMKEIEKIAGAVVEENGYTYDVQVKIEETDFPRKDYGKYSFPEGTYRALRVVIGEGKGHNWWCVMYPNMCFSNTIYELPTEEAEEELKKVLSEEEMAEILESGNYEIHFRFAEWFFGDKKQ